MPKRNLQLAPPVLQPGSLQNAAEDVMRLQHGMHQESETVHPRIRRLLEFICAETGSPHPVEHRSKQSGICDLEIPKRRTIIEIKGTGRAAPQNTAKDLCAQNPNYGQKEDGETVFDQGYRYIQNSIADEMQNPLLAKNKTDWLLIVTDGNVFHFYEFPHRTPHGKFPRITKEEAWRARGAPQLITKLREKIFSRQAVGKPWIPQNPLSLFQGRDAEIAKVHRAMNFKQREFTETKIQLWENMLRGSGIEPAQPAQRNSVFYRHTLLILIARGVIYTLDPKHAETNPVPGDLLHDGFASWLIESQAGQHAASEILEFIHAHDWRVWQSDVLRNIYEALIDDKVRTEMGQYYTPDWTARLLVEEILDPAWITESARAAVKAIRADKPLRNTGMIEPACGSGAFLLQASHHLQSSVQWRDAMQNMNAGTGEQAQALCKLLWGFDIHPVAVEIARATFMRSLPCIPPKGEDELQVYQAESLLMDTARDSLIQNVEGQILYEIPGRNGKTLALPDPLILGENPRLTIRQLVDSAYKYAAANGKGRRAIPAPKSLHKLMRNAEQREALDAAHNDLIGIIMEKGDSIWAWYLLNFAAGHLLKDRKVNRAVGNPPWVPIKRIDRRERQDVMKAMGRDAKINTYQGGKNTNSWDISTLFPPRIRNQYLHNEGGDKAAYLLKDSAIKSEAWRAFREGYGAQHVTQYVSFAELRKGPFDAHAKCCAIFEHHNFKGKKRAKIINALNKQPGKTVQRNEGHKRAFAKMKFVARPAGIKQGPSEYGEGRIRLGATLSPSVLLRVSKETPGARGQSYVQTTPSIHGTWKAVEIQKGTVPTAWLQDMLTAKNLLPFGIGRKIGRVIIPLENGEMVHNPARVGFWNAADAIWRERRGKGAATPDTLAKQIDFQGKLASQIPNPPLCCQVYYNMAGRKIKASRNLQKNLVIDVSLCRMQCCTPDEAAYLTALLNAPGLQAAYLQSQSSDRHFVKQIWRCVPIPKWLEGAGGNSPAGKTLIQQQRELVRLCKRAEAVAQKAEAQYEKTGGKSTPDRIAAAIHGALHQAGITPRIDAIAKAMFPHQWRAAPAPRKQGAGQ